MKLRLDRKILFLLLASLAPSSLRLCAMEGEKADTSVAAESRQETRQQRRRREMLEALRQQRERVEAALALGERTGEGSSQSSGAEESSAAMDQAALQESNGQTRAANERALALLLEDERQRRVQSRMQQECQDAAPSEAQQAAIETLVDQEFGGDAREALRQRFANEPCGMCREVLIDQVREREAVVLPCPQPDGRVRHVHAFHKRCVQQYFGGGSKECPCCRAKISRDTLADLGLQSKSFIAVFRGLKALLRVIRTGQRLVPGELNGCVEDMCRHLLSEQDMSLPEHGEQWELSFALIERLLMRAADYALENCLPVLLKKVVHCVVVAYSELRWGVCVALQLMDKLVDHTEGPMSQATQEAFASLTTAMEAQLELFRGEEGEALTEVLLGMLVRPKLLSKVLAISKACLLDDPHFARFERLALEELMKRPGGMLETFFGAADQGACGIMSGIAAFALRSRNEELLERLLEDFKPDNWRRLRVAVPSQASLDTVVWGLGVCNLAGAFVDHDPGAADELLGLLEGDALASRALIISCCANAVDWDQSSVVRIIRSAPERAARIWSLLTAGFGDGLSECLRAGSSAVGGFLGLVTELLRANRASVEGWLFDQLTMYDGLLLRELLSTGNASEASAALKAVSHLIFSNLTPAVPERAAAVSSEMLTQLIGALVRFERWGLNLLQELRASAAARPLLDLARHLRSVGEPAFADWVWRELFEDGGLLLGNQEAGVSVALEQFLTAYVAGDCRLAGQISALAPAEGESQWLRELCTRQGWLSEGSGEPMEEAGSSSCASMQ